MLKSIGLLLLGIGVFGCIIYPMGYVPSTLSFLVDQGAGVCWGVFIGLVVVGGVLTFMGMKAAKQENQNPS